MRDSEFGIIHSCFQTPQTQFLLCGWSHKCWGYPFLAHYASTPSLPVVPARALLEQIQSALSIVACHACLVQGRVAVSVSRSGIRSGFQQELDASSQASFGSEHQCCFAVGGSGIQIGTRINQEANRFFCTVPSTCEHKECFAFFIPLMHIDLPSQDGFQDTHTSCVTVFFGQQVGANQLVSDFLPISGPAHAGIDCGTYDGSMPIFCRYCQCRIVVASLFVRIRARIKQESHYLGMPLPGGMHKSLSETK